MNDHLNNNSLKIFSILSYFLITISLFIIIQTPLANGYEISIYNAYPWYFWVLITFILLLSTFLSLYMFFWGHKFNTNKAFIHIWGPSFLSIFLVMILPYLRGYPIYGRGDTLSHIGFINDIITYGHTYQDGYPLSHILVVILHYFSGIGVDSLVIFLPAIFIILYMIWMVILGKTVLKKEYLLYLMIILIFFIKFERIQEFSPFDLSLFLVPMFLYTLYKKNNISNSILFVIISITIVFFHIFVAITLILLAISFLLAKYLWKKILKSNLKFIIDIKSKIIDIKSKSSEINVNTNTLVLFSVIVTAWAITMYLADIGGVLSWILYAGGGEDVISSSLNALNSANLNFQELIYTTWVTYGVMLFFYLSPIVLAFILIYKKFKLKLEKRTFELLIIFLSFIFFTILFAFSKNYFSYDRVVNIVVISSIIISTYLIYQLKENINKKKILYSILGSLLSIMMITSLFTLYQSPIDILPNDQVTNNELAASKWFIDHTAYEKVYTVQTNFEINRFLDALQGNSAANSPAYYYYKLGSSIPGGFGYNNSSTLADTVNVSNRPNFNTYMIFCTLDTDYHLVYFKNLWNQTKTYDNESLDKINNDSTANLIYDDGGTQTWLIK